MGTSTSFHPNQMYVKVRSEAKQLCAGELLPDYHPAALVETNKMKNCLAKIDTDYVYFHGTPPCYRLYPQVHQSQKRRTIPLVMISATRLKCVA
jgi:hypothetical protein